MVNGEVVERRLDTPGREPWSLRAVKMLNGAVIVRIEKGNP